MRKKVVAMMLGLVLALTSLGGCGNADSQKTDSSAPASEQESKSEEETTSEETEQTEQTQQAGGTGEESGGIAVDAFAGTELSIAISKNDADMSENFADKPAAKMAEEATGIKINWIVIDGATRDEKVSTMLASGMPDMMIGLIGSDIIAKDMDLFYDLSEEGLLETYAPNVYADYSSIDNAFEAITWSDGSIRTLLTDKAINYNAQARGIMYINKTWLEKLNLEMPTNADELYEVMCAFRDNDLNGNGDTTDEIPYGFCEKHYASMLGHFGGFFEVAGEAEGTMGMAKRVVDGKVIPTFETDEMRACLEYLHRMKEDGLIDVEGFSQTYEQWCAKLADGLVGIFSGWVPATYMEEEMAEQYTLLTPFSAIEGGKYIQTGRYKPLAANTCGAVISADTKNVEAVLHWWNYLSSTTDIKYTAFSGRQGETWDIDETGAYTRFNYEGELPAGWTVTNYGYTYSLLGGGYGPLLRNDELEKVDTSEGTRPYYVSLVEDYLERDYIPVKMTDPDKLSELAFIQTELEAYLVDFVSNSVMEGITDASWEAHLEQLKTVQYDEWIDWYQKFYDGEF